jgi:hypothetical protein
MIFVLSVLLQGHVRIGVKSFVGVTTRPLADQVVRL